MSGVESGVTQADRDVAADIWENYIARTGEVMTQRAMRDGKLDEGLPTILAAHRQAAYAAGVSAERGRCAGIAESRPFWTREDGLWTPKQIAAAIRKAQ